MFVPVNQFNSILFLMCKICLMFLNQVMDDSRAALSKAYNAVRERYNKLRLQHRQLLRDRTCSHCRQKLPASIGTENSPNRQTTSVVSQRSPSDANEILEVCDQLKQLADDGQVVDASCSIHSLIPRLQDVASRLATNTTFDDQNESLLNSSALEMSSSLASATLSRLQLEASAADLLHSQQQSVVPTSQDLASSTTCEMAGVSDQQDTNSVAGRCHKYLYLLLIIIIK